MEQKNKKQNNYVAPVVKVVAFQIEKGCTDSWPESSPTPDNRYNETPSSSNLEDWRHTSSDDVSGYF